MVRENVKRMSRLSRSGSYLFTHQFADDCFGRGMVGGSFDTQPVSGKVVNKNECAAFFRMFCKKAAFAIAGQFRRIFSVVFI